MADWNRAGFSDQILGDRIVVFDRIGDVYKRQAVAYISSAALEGAREGKTLEQVMTDSTKVLTKNDVMEGVADMISVSYTHLESA